MVVMSMAGFRATGDKPLWKVGKVGGVVDGTGGERGWL